MLTPVDLQHAIMTKVLGDKLSLAPISAPNRVLDLGTGTGLWAIEFGSSLHSSDSHLPCITWLLTAANSSGAEPQLRGPRHGLESHPARVRAAQLPLRD